MKIWATRRSKRGFYQLWVSVLHIRIVFCAPKVSQKRVGSSDVMSSASGTKVFIKVSYLVTKSSMALS